jgi:metal-sulfur cluster biosynthetic enzyme
MSDEMTITDPNTILEAELREWLRPVEDPDLYLSLLDLGLIYGVDYDPSKQYAHIKMTLTSPGCPSAGHMIEELKKRALEHPQVKEAQVEIVWEPKWDPKTMASDEVKEELGLW